MRITLKIHGFVPEWLLTSILQKLNGHNPKNFSYSAVRVCEGEEGVSVSEAGRGWRQRGWGLLWSQGSGEGAQLSHKEKKKPDQEFQPAAGLRERRTQTQNHLPSTVRNTQRKNLCRHKLYNLINLCLDSFMMKANVGVSCPAWDGFHC